MQVTDNIGDVNEYWASEIWKMLTAINNSYLSLVMIFLR